MDKLFLKKKLESGLNFLKSNKFEDALKCFEHLIKNKETELIGFLYLGITKIEQNKLDEALDFFNKILEKDDEHEHANVNSGLIYFRQKKYEKSLLFFEKILSKDTNHLVANLHKGIIDYKNLNFFSALNHFKICEELNENIPQLHNYLGNIYFKQNKINLAIKHYKSEILKKNNDSRAKYNLSKCYFSKLLYKDALDLFEYRLSFNINPKAKEVLEKFNPKLWNGESLEGKSILIVSEQGIGDTIQFARYLFYIHEKFNCEIYFYVNKKLLHLFKNCPFNVICNLDNLKSIHYYQYLMSLQRIYFNKYNNFCKNINYINSDHELDQKWKDKIIKLQKPTIAINWQGNPNYTEDHLRSIPLKYFEKIFQKQKYSFISLQKGFGSDQIEQNDFSKYIIDFSKVIDVDNDIFIDTISILKSVDLLITSDTALAHLAGTMEINTCLILNYNPEWRWIIETNKKCFYSEKLHIIKQKKYNDWQSVMDLLSEKLDNINTT